MMKNSANDGSKITPATVEESCQWLLKIRASGYWTIVPSTAEQMCQRLLNSRGSCFFLSSQPTFRRRINVVWTLWINVERTLIRRWKWNKIRRRIFNVAQRWYNVSARRWNNVETTLHNVGTTLIQRCFNLASTLVKAILNPIGLVMIMDLQIDE